MARHRYQQSFAKDSAPIDDKALLSARELAARDGSNHLLRAQLSTGQHILPIAMAVAAALGAALAGATAASAAEKPDYRSAAGSVHLRYLNAGGGDIRAVPRIGLSFGERVMRAELDSGSTGVVVAAALIPGFDQLPVISDGRLTYTSSGRVMIGSWVTTPLSLVGEDGASVTTEPMPILAVTRVECLEQSRNCTPNDDPRDIAMVGIGFAREGDRQAESTPEKNPLLRVSAGTARKGYVLRAEGIDVGKVREAALEIRSKLEELSLPTFVKTSGGKGYHVVVPLKPAADWAAVKGFAHDFARAMEQAAPDRYTATLSKKARTGRIFIDYLRNGKGSTTVAPYSSRAKKGATVSMPVTWREVEDGVAPNAFPVGDKTTLRRLEQADPWADFFDKAKPLHRG